MAVGTGHGEKARFAVTLSRSSWQPSSGTRPTRECPRQSTVSGCHDPHRRPRYPGCRLSRDGSSPRACRPRTRSGLPVILHSDKRFGHAGGRAHSRVVHAAMEMAFLMQMVGMSSPAGGATRRSTGGRNGRRARPPHGRGPGPGCGRDSAGRPDQDLVIHEEWNEYPVALRVVADIRRCRYVLDEQGNGAAGVYPIHRGVTPA